MKFTLQNKYPTLGSLVEDYSDVELHFEDCINGEKFFTSKKANKVILAMYSPYFHRLFKSSKGVSVFHVCFTGVDKHNVTNVLKLMYGGSIILEKKHITRFENFLKMLGIEYEHEQEAPTISNISDSDSPFNHPLPEKQQPDETEVVIEPPSNKNPLKNQGQKSSAFQKVVENSRPKLRGVLGPDEEIDSEFLETCTETPESGLVEELAKVDFKLGTRASDRAHLEYICLHCGHVLKALTLAQRHFVKHHQKRDAEIKILQENIEYSVRVSKEISALKESLQGDYNKTMAICQLETLVKELHRRMSVLRTMIEKNLSPSCLTKRNELTARFSNEVKKVQHLIKMVNK